MDATFLREHAGSARGEALHDFRDAQLLEQGGQARVYKCKWRTTYVALKVFRSAARQAVAVELHVANTLREANGGRTHPGIVRLRVKHAVQVREGRGELAALVYEMGHCDLLRYQDSLGEGCCLGDSTGTRVWLSQVAQALAFCHAAGVAHMDVKPENIILCPARSLTGTSAAKLGDFGSAVTSPGLLTAVASGSAHYAAPEVVALHAASKAAPASGLFSGARGSAGGDGAGGTSSSGSTAGEEGGAPGVGWPGSGSGSAWLGSSMASKSSVHSGLGVGGLGDTGGSAFEAMCKSHTLPMVRADAADVWSFGITLYVVVTGRWPFSEASLKAQDYCKFLVATGQQLADAIPAPRERERDWKWVWPQEVPRQLRHLLTACLQEDPALRCSMAEVVAHPWFATPAPTRRRPHGSAPEK